MKKSGQLRTLASRGFTITEVMIFMAVTAMILISALTAINGAQQRAEFNDSINDVNQQINDVVNNISTGYSASQANFKCNKALDVNGKHIVAGSDSLGTNSDCVFMGKIIRFSKSSEFAVYPALGLRLSAAGKEPQNLKDNELFLGNDTGLIERRRLKNGLTVKSMYVKSDTGVKTEVTAVGFLQNLKRGSGGLFSGGNAQSINYTWFKDFEFGLRPVIPADGDINDTFVGAFGNNLNPTTPINLYRDAYELNPSGDSARNPTNGIIICFEGSGNRKGTITIGGPNRSATTKLEIGNGAC